MPRSPRHYLDDLADDLFEWVQEQIVALTHAFVAGGRSPFAAQTTEAERLAFYRHEFFNRDGTPNEQKRAETINRVGIKGFVEIMDALAKESRPGLPEPEEAGEMPGAPDEREAA